MMTNKRIIINERIIKSSDNLDLSKRQIKLVYNLLRSVSRPVIRMNERNIANRVSLDIKRARDEKKYHMVPQSFTDAAKGIISESLNPSLDRFEDIVDNFSKRLDDQILGVKNQIS